MFWMTAELTMRKSGLLTLDRMWTELVVTDWAPAHQARVKSQGWLMTYRLVLMFSDWYLLKTEWENG